MIRYRIEIKTEASTEEYLCIEEPYTSGEWIYIKLEDRTIMKNTAGVLMITISHVDNQVKTEPTRKRTIGFPTKQ
jgi:hypothetical protein